VVEKKIPKIFERIGISTDANVAVEHTASPVMSPKPKAPPPPKGPKNSRGFGGSQVRRTSGRGR
jgi:hypothetical protein